MSWIIEWWLSASVLAGVAILVTVGLDEIERRRQQRFLRRQPSRRNVIEFRRYVLSAASMGREARSK